MLQRSSDFWSVSKILIKNKSRLLLVLFVNSFKKSSKSFGKANKRIVVIVTFVAFAWLIVFAWPTKSASARLSVNLPTLATNKSDSVQTNLISQQISATTLPFDFKNPLNHMEVSQKFSPDHLAVDLATDYGAEIKPVAAGVVEKSGWDPYGKGKVIVINHGYNLKTLYAHLSEIKVEEGAVVDQDKVIGKVGLTGHSTGAHLHLEVYDDFEPVNPENYFESKLADL